MCMLMKTKIVNPLNAQQIGENAARIWKELAKNGGASTRKLSNELNLKTDDVHLAVGWLAHENKLNIDEKGHCIKFSGNFLK